MNYASIVPLIGGETIAMEQVFGKRPEYIMSYDGFFNNDQHILEHYNNEVPYYNLSQVTEKMKQVDVVNAVCPCAGLSSLSPAAASDNSANDWMVESAKYVLGTVKPKVFWGENAPRLASKMGEPIVERLRRIGSQHGYTFSLFKTKSKLHGLSQVRDRSFYFFWKSETTPLIRYTWRPHQRIEDLIMSVERREDDPMNILTNQKKPTDNPYYKYILEVIHPGMTHPEFAAQLERSENVLSYIEEKLGRTTCYNIVGDWMTEHGYEREAIKCKRMYAKLKAGGNIMRKTIEIPSSYIGAFVGHMPTMLTHPVEDRYLTIRECLTIMKLPDDFILQGGLRNLNHICQNVPVTTAADMAQSIKLFLEGRLESVDSSFVVQDNKNKNEKYEKNSLQLTEFML